MKPIIAIPATLALVYRAYSKKSLTPAGIVAATLTAIAHAVHPWNLPFVLLAVFFLAGTRVTHVKEGVKARLTLPSSGPSGGEGPRTHVQVFANSIVASVCSVLHAYQLYLRKKAIVAHHTGTATDAIPEPTGSLCYSWGGDLLVIGIIANYACVAADTFSSELGILSGETPRLITSLRLRKVPRGTNGGVTLGGLAAGLLGSMIVVTSAMLFVPFCSEQTHPMLLGGRRTQSPEQENSAFWTLSERRQLMFGLTLWGLLGSIFDSILGGLFQRSVRDVRSGKIVEGEGGERVILAEQPNQHLHGVTEASESAIADDDEEEEEVKGDKTEKDGKEGKEGKDGKEKDPYDARNKHRKPSFGDRKPSRVVENGWDLLDNNDVNFFMAFTMTFGAMAVAGWLWGIPLQEMVTV